MLSAGFAGGGLRNACRPDWWYSQSLTKYSAAPVPISSGGKPEPLTRLNRRRAMQSLTAVYHETMPGFHFARIVAAAILLPDPVERRKVIDSARLLLDRGDR